MRPRPDTAQRGFTRPGTARNARSVTGADRARGQTRPRSLQPRDAACYPQGREPFPESCIFDAAKKERRLVPTIAAEQAQRPLDALNFFLADVREGLGPYLAIYLLTEQKWNEANIGIVMSVAGLAGIAVQTPAIAAITLRHSGRPRWSAQHGNSRCNHHGRGIQCGLLFSRGCCRKRPHPVLHMDAGNAFRPIRSAGSLTPAVQP